MKRNRTCGELRKSDEGTIVTLSGWVHKYRNLGGLLFLDLRDRYGITQVIFDPEVVSSEVMDICTKIRNEYVVTVQGIVNVKPEPNKNLPTGEIEIEAKKIRIENESETPPFNFLNGSSDAREDKRLEYRYLDLRSERMTRNIVIRHKATLAVRQFLSDRGFLEIETPTFSKSTPEGARDYVVPSRLFPGSFYALPQSPQIYKQLLMVSGFDKYFQIARCFRDEDARGDRQPEFTQIDIEKSFTDQEEIFKLTEEMYYDMFLKALDTKIESKFVRLTYHESMEKYGVDKPDLRFGLTLKNITDIKDSFDFKVINSAEHVKFIAVEGLEGLSRKQIKVYEDYAIHLGAKGLAFVKYIDGKLEGGISKFLSEENMVEIIKRSELTKNGIIFFGADSTAIVNKVLGNLRNKIGKELRECDIEKLDTNPGEVLGICYDLVLNGVELASGSIRIHDENIQNKVFRTLGLPQEEIDEKFGFMLKAFKYGAPPHGGIAPGLDRTIQIMCGEDTIREVIAFPKAKNLNCPMMKAPSPISEDQLNELNIKLK